MDKEKMNLAKHIDHTLLRPDAGEREIITLCDEAMEYSFKSVCINPVYVKLAKTYLAGSNVMVCTVIGFPLGNNTTQVKSYEAEKAIEDGADELDMVINIGALKDMKNPIVIQDIKSVVEAAEGKTIKAILETSILDEEEINRGCRLAVKAGAHFVKTSTGFGKGGAAIEDVKLMREAVGENFGIKASGGIKDRKKAEDMIKAGANRIGSSNSINIIK